MTSSGRQQYLILCASFAAWMFAGLELSMFVLIGRTALISLMPAGTDEKLIGQWFTWYQGAIMLGAAAGGWVFGWLGDRFGRTRSMACSIACYSLATGAAYFAGAPSQLLAMRFITGMGIGGVWPNAVSLVAEAWPSASRPFLAGLLGTAANVGFVLLGAVGYFQAITPASWRWVPLLGAIPLLLAVLVLFTQESPAWLEKRSQLRSGKPGGRTLNPLQEIFTPPLLRRTLIGILLGAIPVIGTSANGNWLVYWADHAADSSPNLRTATTAKATKPSADPRRKALTQMQRSTGGILGSLLGGFLAAMVGRRLAYFLISLFALLLSSFIFGLMEPSQAYFGVFVFLLGMVGVTYFGWLPLYLPELFPTEVRSTGTGVCFNTGRVVAAMVVLGQSALIVAFEGRLAAVGLVTGLVYAMGMVVICFAPTTTITELRGGVETR